MNKDSHVSKHILCRPRGGLNDMLCQIELCWQHAEGFDRALVIDTSMTAGIPDLAVFFQNPSLSGLGPEVRFSVPPTQMALLATLPCRPAGMTGMISDYDVWTVRPPGGGPSHYCLAKTDLRLSSNLSIDHPEPLLLHDNWGGGDASVSLLKRVQFVPSLAAAIAYLIAGFGPDYAAVHIRHTDYETDWRAFLKTIRRRVKGRTVLICSDSAEVIAEAQSVLANATVRSIPKITRQDGKPLHNWPEAEAALKSENMRAALVDLCALGGASELYITRLTLGNISGFSTLAAALCKDKTVLRALLGPAGVGISHTAGRVHLVETWPSLRLRVFLGGRKRIYGLVRFIRNLTLYRRRS